MIQFVCNNFNILSAPQFNGGKDMGPYDEDKGKFLDHSDVEHDVNNGWLMPSSDPDVFYDGDGNRYDSEYNRIE